MDRQKYFASAVMYIFIYFCEHIEIARVDVSTELTMKNVVFWDMEAQFTPHRKHITSLIQSPAG
jgi:hypothetical protein